MFLLRHELVKLSCCGACVRRRRGCGESRSSIGVAFSNIPGGFPVYASGGTFRSVCFFLSSLVDVSAAGDMILVLAVVVVVLDDDVLCVGLSLDDVFFEKIFCVHARILRELFCTIGAHDSNVGADLMIHGKADGVWRKIFCCSLVCVGDGLTGVDLWRFIYQHEEESGWLLVPTHGGSVPPSGFFVARRVGASGSPWGVGSLDA
ncbi:unnamed protein product [Urochloa humidicola]